MRSKWNYLLTAGDHLDNKFTTVDPVQTCPRLQEHKSIDDPIKMTELVMQPSEKPTCKV